VGRAPDLGMGTIGAGLPRPRALGAATAPLRARLASTTCLVVSPAGKAYHPSAKGRLLLAKGASGLASRLGTKILAIGLKPETPRLTIGVWGTRATGKTTHLSMLPVSVEERRWVVQPSDEATSSFLEQYRVALYEEGRFPGPDEVRAPRPYRFAVRRPRTYLEKVAGRRRSFDITFLDAAGEWCERAIPARLGSPDDPVEYLVACDAILCFLDPTRMRYEGSQYASIVVGVFDALRRRLQIPLSGRLPHRVAFVVPKIDEDELWPNRDRAEAHVMELMGMAPFQDLVDRFRPSHYRFFACSSIGQFNGRSNRERQGDWSVIANRAKIQPFGLFDPLEWLLLSSS
jgi:hypothetical protein